MFPVNDSFRSLTNTSCGPFRSSVPQNHPGAVRLVERDAGALGRIHDGIDCWTCLDRCGLGDRDLRLHLFEPECAVGDPVTTGLPPKHRIEAGGYWMPRLKQLEAGHDTHTIRSISGVS
jgi:hypothetical protein